MGNRDIGDIYSNHVKKQGFGMISERFVKEATVTIHYDDGKKAVHKDVPDEQARGLLSSHSILHKLPELCDKWIEQGGWVSSEAYDFGRATIIKSLRAHYELKD